MNQSIKFKMPLIFSHVLIEILSEHMWVHMDIHDHARLF